MATYKPKKKIDKNGTLDDIKFPMDSIYGLADEFKKKGVHFISDSDITVTSGSSSLSEKWVVNGVDGITEPFDGMLIAIRIPSRGSSPKGVVLSINGGNNYNSLIIVETGSATSFYSAYQNQATILFSFNAIRTGTAYLESGVATNITGCWQTADRDNNYIVTQSKNSEDKEKPILTKYSDSTSTSSGPTSFGLNVTINHAKGRLSATELRENGVSLAEKYALKDEVGGSSRTITSINVSLQTSGVNAGGIDCFTDNDCEIEYDDGNEYAYPPASLRIPITAGEGIEFVEEENKTVSINATGGAGLENVEILDMYMGMVEPPQTDDGIYWVEKAQARNGDDSVIKEFNAYHHIPIVSGEGIKFEQNEEQEQVKISTDLPTVKAKLTPASEVGGGSIKTEDLPYLSYVDISTGEVDETNISTNGIFSYHKDVERELIDEDGSRHYLYSDFGLFVPIVAGEGIEFVNEENNTVSINATGDDPVYIVGSNADDGIHNVNVAADGIEFTDTYEDEYSDGSYQYPDKRTKIPVVAGEGIEFIADNENNIVKINSTVEVPTSTSQLENDSDFATKSDINALIAKTEQEFNSLITIENEGKAISYNKKMYLIVVNSTGSNPPKVGDVITELYFNTDIEPNFSDFVLEDGGAILFITDVNPTTSMMSLFMVSEVTEETFGAGTPHGYTLGIQHNGELTTLYATEDYDVGNIHASKGWNFDKFELGWSATIQTVLQQEIWGTFISKTPFDKEIVAKEVGGGGISGAWTSGAGGTLTLPEAGTYQLKTDFSDGTVGGVTTFSQIVCWDGNLPTESATLMTLVESDLMCYRFSIGATGVINIKVTVYGQYPMEMDWANMNVEYRKIGEA